MSVLSFGSTLDSLLLRPAHGGAAGQTLLLRPAQGGAAGQTEARRNGLEGGEREGEGQTALREGWMPEPDMSVLHLVLSFGSASPVSFTGFPPLAAS